MTNPSRDKAGKAYWDRAWAGQKLATPVNPRVRGLRYHVLRSFHGEFARALGGMDTAGSRLLEIGCAGSAWLPYFAREYGFQISGLDYSEHGCAQEREILSRAGIPGDIVCADMFDPPPSMAGAFDVVVSLGVVEHFEDTAACLRACAHFLRPGGRIITEVPNMHGLVGWVTKTTNRPVYDIHVPLDREALAQAHRDAGLRVLHADYILPMDWSIFGFTRIASPWLRWPLLAPTIGLVGALWALDERGLAPRPNRLTSPFIFCAAEKPPPGAEV